MEKIIIKTQQELDSLPKNFDEFTYIEIRAKQEILLTKIRGKSSVVARDNSSVVARNNSSVVARDNSSVVAWGNSSVWAEDNSYVEAGDNSSVWARDNSSVVAWGNSYVEAGDNSSVEAWDNNSVEAWGNSSVEARGRTTVQVLSSETIITLFAFAVAIIAKNITRKKVKKKSKYCHIQVVKELNWFEENGFELKKNKKSIILYKRVSNDFKTQEGMSYETSWNINTTLTHPNWRPQESECGEGKFHACSKPYFCDEFRSKKDDRYIAIRVNISDLYIWKNPTYPHKIAFRKGKVLYECDRFGKNIGGCSQKSDC